MSCSEHETPSSAEPATAEAMTAEPASAEALTAEPSTAEAMTAEPASAEAMTAEAASAEALTAEAASAEALTAEASSAEALTAEASSAEALTAEASTSGTDRHRRAAQRGRAASAELSSAAARGTGRRTARAAAKGTPKGQERYAIELPSGVIIRTNGHFTDANLRRLLALVSTHAQSAESDFAVTGEYTPTASFSAESDAAEANVTVERFSAEA